jgi:hypothetical protein
MSNYIFRYTINELHSMATQYISNMEAAEFLPVPGSKEATLDNSNVAPSEASVQDAKSSAKGSKKRFKRCPKWITTKADYDDDNNKKIDSSDLGCVAPAAHSGKCQVRSPIEHFERLLEEDCSNHP